MGKFNTKSAVSSDAVSQAVFDAAGPGGEIPITQNQLASMAGVSLRLANRVVGEARAAGLLDTANRRIVVRNWDALVARCRTSGPSAAFL